jgi:hypothetical protein
LKQTNIAKVATKMHFIFELFAILINSPKFKKLMTSELKDVAIYINLGWRKFLKLIKISEFGECIKFENI